jgi:MFS family permease
LQAVKGYNALLAGVGILPLILGQVGGNLMSGALITKMGYYVPFMWLSVVFMAIGSGLLTTLTQHSSTGMWVGYQIIDGIGIGFGWPIGALAAQTVLDSSDIPVGTAIAVFMLLFGGAVFVSAANSIFTNSLVNGLTAANIQGVDSNAVVHLGATQLRHLVHPEDLGAVLDAYMKSLTDVYRLALVLACMCAAGAIGMEWVDVRKKKVSAMGTAA